MSGKAKTDREGVDGAPRGKEAERRARQAEALRANLRRRKLQARERAETGGPGPNSSDPRDSRDT